MVTRVKNPSNVNAPKKRSIDLEFQVTPGSLRNERNSVKTRFEMPPFSKESISEGAVFSVPPGGSLVRIVVDVPPGASPGCFDEIIYSLKTREAGTNMAEIERKNLARNVCVEETLTTDFTDFFFDEETQARPSGTNRVIANMIVGNSSQVEQLARLEISNCSFKIAEMEAMGPLKNVKKRAEDPDLPLTLRKSIVIPPNTNTILTLYFTPKAGEKPSSPWNCTVKPLREFDKQSPKPK